jgi:Mlc titration factor MtfA (ptsG expression regulator)
MRLFGRRRERQDRLDAGFLPEWRDVLDQRMSHWSQLDDDERARLESIALGLMVDKRWEAAQGFELTDDIIVTIAGQAALLALELPDDCYDDVGSIIVHPTTMVISGEHSQVSGLVSDEPMSILGEAHYGGPVLIVWDAVLAEARHPGRGHNVVIHEFAHKLDMIDGTVDGTPPLASREQFDRWVEVCTRVYEEVARGEGGRSLEPYASVNAAEFFAVATEVFFDNPLGLRHDHPDLYEVLGDYYRQDPASRSARQSSA